jgi:F-type H+-transporting ATPase subunit epsilon
MALFRLQIQTQQQTVFDEDVESIVLPGLDGYFGIRQSHAPIIAVLAEGPVTVRKSGTPERILRISGGFVEMRDNKATLLVDALEGAAVT